MVNFPIEGLDLEDRVSERRIAKSLDLSDDECREYGIEPTDEPLVYDLCKCANCDTCDFNADYVDAVDNHFGGMGGGHYTAFCKNKVDNQWYNYDDSRVSPATERAVESRAAYLLFYRRRSKRPIGGVSRIKAQEASRAVSPELNPDVNVNNDAESSNSSSSSASSSPGRPSHQLPSYRQTIDSDDGIPSSPPGLPTPPSSDDGRGPLRDVDGDGHGDADEWPPSFENNTPPEPASPNVSDTELDRPSTDLGALGKQLGFGNTAWGTKTISTSFDDPQGGEGAGTPASSAALGENDDVSTPTTTAATDTETNTSADEENETSAKEAMSDR